MNFSEKLSIKKVYANAVKYTATHPKGFLFLTLFYYIASLPPFSNIYLHLISMYLLLYFAAGLYYKQRILLNTSIFMHATLRFITAIMLFIISMLICSLGINILIHIFCNGQTECTLHISRIMQSNYGNIARYLFLFFLLIAFFLIPSFAFISEISGKSRSVIGAYVKTKNNLPQIAFVVLSAIALTWLFMAIFAFVNPYIAQLAYTLALVFGTIIYFKMYDFFYNIQQTKRTSKPKEKADTLKTEKVEEKENAN